MTDDFFSHRAIRRNDRQKRAVIALSALAALTAAPTRGARAQTITCIQPLIYGTIGACSSTQTMTIAPNGSVSVSNPCLSYMGSQVRATCSVMGDPFAGPMRVSVVGAPATINAGGDNMSVGSFDIDGQGSVVTISASFATLDVGATLTVDGGQAAGSYSGTVTVSVEYVP